MGKKYTPDCVNCRWNKRMWALPFDREYDECQEPRSGSAYSSTSRQMGNCGLGGKFFKERTLSTVQRLVAAVFSIPVNEEQCKADISGYVAGGWKADK